MGEKWKKMSDKDKKPYFELAKKHSEEHKQVLRFSVKEGSPNPTSLGLAKSSRTSIRTFQEKRPEEAG
jgi:hypothetical protein